MEHKIGEVFENNGVVLMVQSSTKWCLGCHFWSGGLCLKECNIEDCRPSSRKDHKDVIFLKIKDNTNNNKDMETRNIKIDLKTAKEWFNGSDETLEKLALQAYKEEELKDGLPKTWREFCKQNPIQKGEVYIGIHGEVYCYSSQISRDIIKTALPNSKSAEAHIALMQLERLRDCYRNGWEPDWENKEEAKYTIGNFNNVVKKGHIYEWSSFLTFQSEELRDKFFDNFKYLIEVAKELI